jgi:hypothetical protein
MDGRGSLYLGPMRAYDRIAIHGQAVVTKVVRVSKLGFGVVPIVIVIGFSSAETPAAGILERCPFSVLPSVV